MSGPSTPPPGTPARGARPSYPDGMAVALTLQQASEHAGVPADELEQLCREGRVTGAMWTGERWALRREDLDAWLATRS